MRSMILDHEYSQRLIDERAMTGADRFDEVWEGIYMMSPLANNEHQELASLLTTYFTVCLKYPRGSRIFGGVNVTDRPDDWTKNYRCPDVAVYLVENPATDKHTHWLGGPDLAVEIVSEGDRSRDKFEFYESVNTRELLIVDRDPWQLELFRLIEGKLKSVAIATPGQGIVESSLGVTMGLDGGDADGFDRPPMSMRDLKSDQSWTL